MLHHLREVSGRQEVERVHQISRLLFQKVKFIKVDRA